MNTNNTDHQPITQYLNLTRKEKKIKNQLECWERTHTYLRIKMCMRHTRCNKAQSFLENMEDIMLKSPSPRSEDLRSFAIANSTHKKYQDGYEVLNKTFWKKMNVYETIVNADVRVRNSGQT